MIYNTVASYSDMRELFVEEAGEVFKSIDDELPLWRKHPTDSSALTEIRRSFHTLKGSGRMVNALDLAEVAWKVENMLNCVIERSVEVTEPMIELVSQARESMPRMLDAFKNRRSTESDSNVELLGTRADALAAGQEPPPVRAHRVVVAAESDGEQSLRHELAAVKRSLVRIQQRSDEALHRSEMALYHARRIVGHIDAIKAQSGDRVASAKVDRVVEQVGHLAGEIRDLRWNNSQTPSARPREGYQRSQRSDPRIRWRMEPIERQLKDLQQQLNQDRRETAASRKLILWAFGVGSFVAGGAFAMLMVSGLAFG